MPSRSVSSDYESPVSNARREPFARSVLKRAALGVVLLLIIVSGGAWLMHNGIEAEAEPALDEVAISRPADRTR